MVIVPAASLVTSKCASFNAFVQMPVSISAASATQAVVCDAAFTSATNPPTVDSVLTYWIIGVMAEGELALVFAIRSEVVTSAALSGTVHRHHARRGVFRDGVRKAHPEPDHVHPVALAGKGSTGQGPYPSRRRQLRRQTDGVVEAVRRVGVQCSHESFRRGDGGRVREPSPPDVQGPGLDQVGRRRNAWVGEVLRQFGVVVLYNAHLLRQERSVRLRLCYLSEGAARGQVDRVHGRARNAVVQSRGRGALVEAHVSACVVQSRGEERDLSSLFSEGKGRVDKGQRQRRECRFRGGFKFSFLSLKPGGGRTRDTRAQTCRPRRSGARDLKYVAWYIFADFSQSLRRKRKLWTRAPNSRSCRSSSWRRKRPLSSRTCTSRPS
eukprot:30957-Pelagococcus_subviridis.AAC.36